MIVEKILTTLENFGIEVKNDLRKKLRDKGVTYEGNDSRLSASIDYKVVDNNGSIKFILSLNDYYKFVDGGRNKGNVSKLGQSKLKDWASRKAIVGDFIAKDFSRREDIQSKSKRKKLTALKPLPFDKGAKALAFLISRKIKNKGYKGNNFYSEVITDDKLKDLTDKLKDIIKKEVIIEVKK